MLTPQTAIASVLRCCVTPAGLVPRSEHGRFTLPPGKPTGARFDPADSTGSVTPAWTPTQLLS